MPRQHQLDKEYLQKLIRQNSVPNENDCWIWSMALGSDGYGRLMVQGTLYLVHRLSAWVFGVVDDIFFATPIVRHRANICKSKACVNPAHLMTGDRYDNFLDAVKYNENTVAAMNFKKEVCINGHPFNEENTRWGVSRNGRPCRICRACVRELARSKRLISPENYRRKD